MNPRQRRYQEMTETTNNKCSYLTVPNIIWHSITLVLSTLLCSKAHDLPLHLYCSQSLGLFNNWVESWISAEDINDRVRTTPKVICNCIWVNIWMPLAANSFWVAEVGGSRLPSHLHPVQHEHNCSHVEIYDIKNVLLGILRSHARMASAKKEVTIFENVDCFKIKVYSFSWKYRSTKRSEDMNIKLCMTF